MSDAAARVRAAARVAAVPSVPEIRLYQAAAEADLWYLSGGAYRSDVPPPFWAFAWAGGRALARYLLDYPETVAGRVVLDLAAGSGVVGIAAAKAGAARVIAVDIDRFAVAAIALNAAENGVRIEAVTGDPLAWSSPGGRDATGGDAAGEEAGAWVDILSAGVDVVLAGDVFYSATMADRMYALLRRLARTGVRVLIGDADREYLPRTRVRALATYRLPVPAALEGRRESGATVWELGGGGQ